MSAFTRSSLQLGTTLAILTGCGNSGGGGTSPPPPPPPPSPVVLDKATPSGDNQTGEVNTQLPNPLRVRATRGGAASAGEAVTWATSSGQVVGSGATGADGIATGTWTLGGTAGPQTATATSGNSTVQFSATATSPPATFVIAKAQPSGDAQAGVVGTMLPQPVQVVVTQNGAPVSGQVVTWQTGAAHGFFDQPQVTTTQAGVAAGRWFLGTPLGAQSATATLQANGASVTFGAMAAAGPAGDPVEIHLTELGGVARFTPAVVQVAVGTTVRWIWDDGVHTVTSHGQPTFPGNPGQANPPTIYQFTFAQAGTYSFYCIVHGTQSTGMRGQVVVQ